MLPPHPLPSPLLRYRCRRADAASKRNTAAHALVCLSSSVDEAGHGEGHGRAGGHKGHAGGRKGGGGGGQVRTAGCGNLEAAAGGGGGGDGRGGAGEEAWDTQQAVSGEDGRGKRAGGGEDGVANLLAAGLKQEGGCKARGEDVREGQVEQGGEEEEGGGEQQKGERGEGDEGGVGRGRMMGPTSGEDAALVALTSLFAMTPPPLPPAPDSDDERVAEPSPTAGDEARPPMGALA